MRGKAYLARLVMVMVRDEAYMARVRVKEYPSNMHGTRPDLIGDPSFHQVHLQGRQG